MCRKNTLVISTYAIFYGKDTIPVEKKKNYISKKKKRENIDIENQITFFDKIQNEEEYYIKISKRIIKMNLKDFEKKCKFSYLHSVIFDEDKNKTIKDLLYKRIPTTVYKEKLIKTNNGRVRCRKCNKFFSSKRFSHYNSNCKKNISKCIIYFLKDDDDHLNQLNEI